MVSLFIELGKLDQLAWVLQWLSPGHVSSFSHVELHSFELLSGAPSPPFLRVAGLWTHMYLGVNGQHRCVPVWC